MSLPFYSGDTTIDYKYAISSKSRIIYVAVLVIVAIIACSLPFLKTKISVKSPGVLRSSLEKIEINIPVSGRLIVNNLMDNQQLIAGDTLLVIDATLPQQQSDFLQERIVLIRQLLQDIGQLLKSDNSGSPNLYSGQYNASWQKYTQELANASNEKIQAERVFKRYEKLYLKNVLTASEFEKYQFEHEKAANAVLLLQNRVRSEWQVDAGQLRNELKSLYEQKAVIIAQRNLYTVVAQVTGSVQNLSGFPVGGYVFANQRIGEISPGKNLIAYCYIKPADIGLIYRGQQVRFQIGAFNYNQWGLATGTVLDISDDVIVLNGAEAVFKVKCRLDKNHLQLKNGYRGDLVKGMNFTARFLVAERSLYQLLYDKIDDWVNPNLNFSNE